MLLKSFASHVLLFSSLFYLTAVSGAPQATNSASAMSSKKSAASGGPEASGFAGSSASPASASPTNPSPTPSSSAGAVDSNGAPDVSKVEGYNVFALSFLLSTGPQDQAKAWADLDESKRKDVKSKYQPAGVKLIVSAFGAFETPTTSGADSRKVANDMAKFVKQYGLDGIDVDYEDLDAMNKGDGKAEELLNTFTKTLRSQLPQDQYILTHAAVAPWEVLTYQTVNKEVGNMIDWYNIQFYNQNDYTDCDSLLTKSKTKSSVFEIADSGVGKNKLVIGKPATAADATNGYVDTETLATCVSQAKQNAGVIVWQYPNADSGWIKTVRGHAFPVGQ